VHVDKKNATYIGAKQEENSKTRREKKKIGPKQKSSRGRDRKKRDTSERHKGGLAKGMAYVADAW